MKPIKDTLEKIIHTIKFWLWIVREAFIAAFLFSEMKGGIIEVVKSIALNLLAFLGIGATQNFEISSILYWIGLLFVIRFILYLLYLPSKFFYEKRKEAYRLTWLDVEIKEFIFPKQSGFAVGLEIINKKLKNDWINDAKAEITYVRRLGVCNNNSFVARLAWAIGAKSIYNLLWEGTILYQNDSRILLIAKSDGSKGWIETQDKERQTQPIILDTNVHYQFAIELKGRLEGPGYDLLRCTVSCDLVYNSINDKFDFKITQIDSHYLGYGGSKSQFSDFGKDVF